MTHQTFESDGTVDAFSNISGGELASKVLLDDVNAVELRRPTEHVNDFSQFRDIPPIDTGLPPIAVLVAILAHRLMGTLPVPLESHEPVFQRSALIEQLFRGTFLVPSDGAALYRAFWTAEALNRAVNLLRLVLLLEKRSALDDEYSTARRAELRHGERLAAIYHSLYAAPDMAILSCVEPLVGVMGGLVTLFGSTVGHVSITTKVSPLSLPVYKRRALVLIASELVIQALLRGFRGLHHGQIRVTLDSAGKREVRFLLDHDGISADIMPPATSFDITSALAALLGAEMVYRRSPSGGTSIELLFSAQ